MLFTSIIATNITTTRGIINEQNLKSLVEKILEKIIKKFDIEIIMAKYPISFSSPMNSFLLQEIFRYNLLTNTIWTSLKEIEYSLSGQNVLPDALENVQFL